MVVNWLVAMGALVPQTDRNRDILWTTIDPQLRAMRPTRSMAILPCAVDLLHDLLEANDAGT
jgi:hypothetical protein